MLTDVDYFKSIVSLFSDHKTRIFQAIMETLRWFAGRQIRNVAVS